MGDHFYPLQQDVTGSGMWSGGREQWGQSSSVPRDSRAPASTRTPGARQELGASGAARAGDGVGLEGVDPRDWRDAVFDQLEFGQPERLSASGEKDVRVRKVGEVAPGLEYYAARRPQGAEPIPLAGSSLHSVVPVDVNCRPRSHSGRAVTVLEPYGFVAFGGDNETVGLVRSLNGNVEPGEYVQLGEE